MLDGASNNDTMLAHLATLLESRDIHFDPDDRRVACFVHTIDLASKAVILDANAESQGSPVTLACNVV